MIMVERFFFAFGSGARMCLGRSKSLIHPVVLHKSKLLVCRPELDRDVQGKPGRKGDVATGRFLLTSRPANSHNVSAL